MTFTDDEQKIIRKLEKFKTSFSGDIFTDDTMRILYATDASLYRKIPLAVVYPKTNNDLKNLILFSRNNSTSLIPRTAGTSLGGQCVGRSIIVDTSHYLNQILEINTEENYAIVQPGVVRDELNIHLKQYGLYFGPNTATSNRAMIGGMVGNNSSGSYSIKYGTTRENILSVKGYLSDGSEVEFGELTTEEFRLKSHGITLESAIYRQISFELNHPLAQVEIDKEFPKSTVTRRNTGYALDFLLNTEPFHRGYDAFNFAKMLCGSEGTLMMFSDIKVKLFELPSENNAMICAHFDSLDKSLKAAVEAMKLLPNQCELMDKKILDCTKDNIIQSRNRFFIQGDPQAILMIEVEEKSDISLDIQIQNMKSQLRDFTNEFSVLYGDDIKRAMSLRASGLGVLQNMKGVERPLEFIEDTAVAIEDLPAYIAELDAMIISHNSESVYYAHAGAGELHVRPKVNLKSADGRKKFRAIATDSAHLVKKYGGSLSGEHGDGIVRGEFIPIVVGKRNFELMKRVKQTWDPLNIFNPEKITNAPPMDENLREDYEEKNQIKTIFSFEKEGSLIDAAEKCSGSGDCRKTELIGGTLCPSFQATRNEKDSTRARANLLREFLTHNTLDKSIDSEELYEVMKLCLSCKACISECPSSVDMAALKSEFLHQYHKKHSLTKIEKSTANFYKLSTMISPFAWVTNIVQKLPLVSHSIKYFSGIDQRRSLPSYSVKSFEKWHSKSINHKKIESTNSVYLYVDEFSNYLDAEIARKAYLILTKLDINVIVLPYMDSGRSLISKGFLEEAKVKVNALISQIRFIADSDFPLIGIEPSAILGFKDDYHRLVTNELKADLDKISKKTYLIEDYLADLFSNIPALKSKFNQDKKEIIYHGHCHQKALSSSQSAIDILNFPVNYSAVEIPSGCCGMAGSFGYEHYDISMKIGEMILFPTIRNQKEKSICASGTSCRHQIKDGTDRHAKHPIEELYQALIKA